VATVTVSTTLLFSLLVLVMAAVVVGGLRRAGWGSGTVVTVLLAYLAVPAVLARLGALDRYSPLPAPALLLLSGLTVGTVWLVFSRYGAKVAFTIPVASVALLQGFRIPVEWLLHRLYLEGAIPIQMTYSGRNWDIISGVTGLALGWFLRRGRRERRLLVLAWNVLGLALLVNIVTIAVLATPVPFRQFTDGPANLLPSTFPWVWLPSFLVQLALASRLLVFRQLSRPAQRPAEP